MPVPADFLLPGYVGADLVDNSPTYQSLCALHSGLRDTFDHYRKTGHRSPIELLRDMGWQQAVFPKYFFEGGVHPRGGTVAPDFFLLNTRTINLLGAAAGVCTRPGRALRSRVRRTQGAGTARI